VHRLIPCIDGAAVFRRHASAIQCHSFLQARVPLIRVSAALALAAASLVAPAAWAQPRPLLPLRAPAGLELLLESSARADYGTLAEALLTQANLAYCGVASSVMVLNSLAVPAPPAAGYGTYRFWTQENLFDPPATRRLLTPEQVARRGMTLQQLAGLLRSHGLAVRAIHGDQLSLEQFRVVVRRNLEEPRDRLLVNYHRSSLGQDGGGHIAPVAAYHAGRDQVLILDVARYRYPSVWVPLADLWAAIRTVDASSGRSRGLVSIRRLSSTADGSLGVSGDSLRP
jgi:hypothetical protein